jgi:hypothetical protein
MAPTAIFPDATWLVIDHLRAALAARSDTAIVASEVPNPRPDRLVYVHLGGGVRRSVVSDAPQIDIEVWDVATEDAHDLAQLCRALIHTMPGQVVNGVAVYRVDEFAGPADLPDPLTDNPRVVFTVQIHLRGSALT